MRESSLHVCEMGVYAFWTTAEKSRHLSIALLQDDDVRTRRAAVNALARSSPLAGDVVLELIAALTDQDAAACAGSVCALGNVWPPPRAAVLALMQASNHPDRTVRESATAALAEISDELVDLRPLEYDLNK